MTATSFVNTGLDAARYSTSSQLPTSAPNGALAVTLNTGYLYEFNANTPGWQLIGSGAAGVTSVNGLTGAVIVTAGTAIGVAVSGQDVVVTNDGVTSLNSLSGALSLIAGTGITVTPSGSNITLASTGGSFTPVTITGATGTVNIDWSAGNNWIIDLSGNIIITCSNMQAGQSILLRLYQDATGNRTITWPSNVFWANDTQLITSGPLRLDEVVLDYDGTNFNATYAANFPTSHTLTNVDSLQFVSASNQSVNFGNVYSFDKTSAFSFGCWIYLTTNTSNPTICGKIDTSIENGYAWGIYQDKLYVQMQGSSGGSIFVQGTTTLATSTWYFVVWTNTGSGLATGQQFYINGVADTMNVITNTLTQTLVNTSAFYLGFSYSNGYLNGYMDEVYVDSGTAVSSTTIVQRYNSGTPLNPTSISPSPTNWYRMGDSPDSATASGGIADRIGSINGTGSNMTSANIVAMVP